MKKNSLSFRRSSKKFYKKSERNNTKIALVICLISSIMFIIDFGFGIFYINSKTIKLELISGLEFLNVFFMILRNLVNFPILYTLSKKFNKVVKESCGKLQCSFFKKQMDTFSGVRRKSTAKVGFDDIQLENDLE